MKCKTYNSRGGQMMIMSMMALGGTLLAATTIAGLLLVYQIREAGDAASSAKAIFAADAGIEWGLYRIIKDPAAPEPIFSNGASFTLTCNPSECSTDTITSMRSLGRSGKAARALELAF